MSLEERKERLRKDIERSARYLQTLENMPDFDQLDSGTVLGLAVTYGPSRAYPVIAYKGDANWYLTSTNAPKKMTSDELAEWLASGGRHLRMAQVLAEFSIEAATVFDLGAALDSLLSGRGL